MRKKLPTIRVVFDRKKVATKTKKGLLQYEIYINKQRKYYTTGIKLYADQWNDRKMIVNHLDADLLNNQIYAQLREFQRLVGSAEKNISFEDIATLFEQKDDSGKDFITYALRYTENAEIKENSRKTYYSIIRTFRRYGREWRLGSITLDDIIDFDAYLHSLHLKQTTISAYHSKIQHLLSEAEKQELQVSPYKKFSYKRGKSDERKYLSASQLAELERLDLDYHFSIVRDCFLFQCYTGLAYVDLANFDFSNVEKRGDKYVYIGKRQKTNEPFYVVLMSQAMKILERNNYVLKVKHIVYYNHILHELGYRINLDFRLSSHIGRHTFAVMALNSGVRIESVAKMLGHADIKTTQIYAKIVDKQIENDFEMLEAKLK